MPVGKTTRSSELDMDAMLAIVAAMRHAVDRWVGPNETEVKKAEHRAERFRNAIEHFKIFVGVLEWRYLFLPIGVQVVSNRFDHGGSCTIVTTRQLHVFGLRVARWVVDSKVYRLTLVNPPPSPIRRIRPWRRRQSGRS